MVDYIRNMDAFNEGSDRINALGDLRRQRTAIAGINAGVPGSANALSTINPELAQSYQSPDQVAAQRMQQQQAQQQENDYSRQRAEMDIQSMAAKVAEMNDEQTTRQVKQESERVAALSVALKQVPPGSRRAWVDQNAQMLQQQGFDLSKLGNVEDDAYLDYHSAVAQGVNTAIDNMANQQRLEQQRQYQQGQLGVAQQRANQQGANVQSQIAKRAAPSKAGSGKSNTKPWARDWSGGQ